eukprot:UN03337
MCDDFDSIFVSFGGFHAHHQFRHCHLYLIVMVFFYDER